MERTHKRCPRCGETKPLAEWYISNSTVIRGGGLAPYCRPCYAEYRKERKKILGVLPKKFIAPDGQKRCFKCKTVKPVTDFHRNSARRDGLDTRCRACSTANHPAIYIKHKYGMDAQQHADMLEKQGGACAICRLPEPTVHLGKSLRLSVDHDHATNKVRGLLCYRCNHLVGYLERSNGPTLKAAVSYLQIHGVTVSV